MVGSEIFEEIQLQKCMATSNQFLEEIMSTPYDFSKVILLTLTMCCDSKKSGKQHAKRIEHFPW